MQLTDFNQTYDSYLLPGLRDTDDIFKEGHCLKVKVTDIISKNALFRRSHIE